MANIFEFIIPIVLLIIIHEFGHLIAAKFFGIEVEEFGLGFPPRALKLFTWGGTLFSLNWIPLGGFVRPKGENDPGVEGGLAAANPFARIGVLVAGPLANLLVAVAMLAVVFIQLGRPDVSKVMIYAVDENTPAEQANMQAGDLILEVNNNPINSTSVLIEEIRKNIGLETNFSLLREDEIIEVSAVPRANPPEGQGAVGIQLTHPTLPVGLIEAARWGMQGVYEESKFILTIPARIFRGAIAPEEARLIGYKGMYDLYQNVKEIEIQAGVSPLINTLAFFSTISISLGLLNLMPIPAVDGGRILFTLPEIIFRRRIPQNFENVVNFISFSLLIILMIYVNVQDFVNPAQF